MTTGAILAGGAKLTSGTVILGSATGTTQTVGLDIARIQLMAVQLNVTASTAPTSLNVYFQHSVDGGLTWDDFISFTTVTTGTSRQIAQWDRDTAPSPAVHAAADGALTAGTVLNGPVGDDWRLKWAIVGTSYTFTVIARQIQRQRG